MIRVCDAAFLIMERSGVLKSQSHDKYMYTHPYVIVLVRQIQIRIRNCEEIAKWIWVKSRKQNIYL